MARADTPAAVPVEILVKQNELVPIGIRLKFLNVTIDRSLAFLIAQENLGKPAREFSHDFPQSKHLAGVGGKLDCETIAKIMMKLLQ